MTDAPRMRLGRSRTVRAAAMVAVGLTATACDETPPPDTPLDSAGRLEACEAAHRRLSADPARCAVLERVAQQEQVATRPRFSSRSDCEAAFGPDACEGSDSQGFFGGAMWRPVLVGWSDTAGPTNPLPVVRDREGQLWSLGGADQDPQMVAGGVVPSGPGGSLGGGTDYDRRVPVYDDRKACEAGWERCQPTVLPNRFVDQRICEAVWGVCQELSLPGTAIASSASSSGGGVGGHGGSGYVHHGWWRTYNHVWFDRYSTAYAPRWQGWGWTGDRAPTATYHTARSTGSLAWDSSTRRLAPARSLASIAGDGARGALASSTDTVSRAGFGSTGRSYSAGG